MADHLGADAARRRRLADIHFQRLLDLPMMGRFSIMAPSSAREAPWPTIITSTLIGRRASRSAGEGPRLRHVGRSGDREAQGRARRATFYFCSARCRERFIAEPAPLPEPRRSRSSRARPGGHDLHLPDASRDPAGRAGRTARSAAWRSSPRSRRPRTGPNPELAGMTRRFWVALALTHPASFALEMGGHLADLAGWLARRLAGSNSRWRRRSCSGRAGRSSCAALRRSRPRA